MIPAILAAAALQSAGCSPPADVDLLWSDDQTRFIFVGEIHGTVEIPAAFGEIVCAAAAQREVTIGIEFEDAVQADLDRWMVSDGGPQARDAFRNHISWTRRFQDGRSSVAMWNLLERLRQLKASGRELTVVAFRPNAVRPHQFGQAYGELEMAQSLSGMAQAHPEALNLILVGNVHAAKIDNGRFRPAASLLPPSNVVSIVAHGAGGEAWVCAGEPLAGQPPESVCRAAPMAGRDDGVRGVILDRMPDGSFDGRLEIGPITASPPAISR